MTRKTVTSLLIGSLFALSLGLSAPVRAQKPATVPAKRVDPNEALSKTVSLQIENGSLAEAFKMVLKQIDYPYSLILPNIPDKITINTNGSAGVVLDMLTQASSLPLDYRIEHETIKISRKQAEAPPEPDEPEPEFVQRVPKIKRLNYGSATEIIKEISKFPEFKDAKIIPTDGDGTMLITVNNEREERNLANLERVIDLFDVQPIPLIMKAELIVEFNGDSPKRTQAVFVATGTTFSGKEITLDINLQGETTAVSNNKAASAKGMKVDQGLCRFTVTPRFSGSDETTSYEMITLNTEGTMQLEITAEGYAKPLKFSRKFTGADRVRLVDSHTLMSSTVKLETDKNPLNASISLRLTVSHKPQQVVPPQNGGKLKSS